MIPRPGPPDPSQTSRIPALGASLALCLVTLAGFRAAAQQYTPHEIGIGVVSQTASPYVEAPSYTGSHHDFAGPQGRYTWNLSPSLALEGSVGYLPGFQSSFAGDNGHELIVLGGVKAGLRRRHFGIYGKAEPGLASFSPGLTLYRYQLPTLYERRSEFTLDTGGVFELYPSRRTIVRFDISQTLLAEYDQVVARPNPYLKVIEEGHIATHLGLALSVAHRFGTMRDEQEAEPARSSLNTGILFSLQQRVHQSNDQIPPDRGTGIWLSYNFTRYLSLDGATFYEPQDDHAAFPQDGGRTFLAFAGLKAGIRRDHLGYFVKARPGLIQFSRTEQQGTETITRAGVNIEFTDAKTTDFATDIGGVIEFYPSRRLILRADAGNAAVHYHAADLLFTTPTGSAKVHYPPFERSTILLLFGAGWRFYL